MATILTLGMDLSRPYSALAPTLDLDVLAVLAGTTAELTGREIAGLTRRGSQAGVQRVLTRLVDHGLVTARRAGRARLYALNRDHLAAPAAEIAADMRAELVRRLRAMIGAWPVPPEQAVLFGSAARGDGGTSSDIDLLVIRAGEVEDADAWDRQLRELADDVTRLTGNHAAIIEMESDQLARLGEANAQAAESLARDGIVLHPDA